MKLLIQSDKKLNLSEITAHLRQLRTHAVIDSSHFAVAAMIQLKRPEGQYVYVCGVNVEHHEHNRLGMHAEQNAIAAAQSLFGENVRFLNAWVMGAMDTIEHDSEDALASNFVQPCGHCRQILMSFSLPETQIYSIALNGTEGEPANILSLLPHAFSERDLEETTVDFPTAAIDPEISTSGSTLFSMRLAPKLEAWKLLQQPIAHLSDSNIRLFCNATMPHVINPSFETSRIHVCMIKVPTPEGPRYFSGALVQDIAFLTTDAIFSSIGQAVTEVGGHQLQLDEIHLYGANATPDQLSGCELSHLTRFSNARTRVKFHTPTSSSEPLSLAQCVETYATQLLARMQLTTGALKNS